jgi:hypothetical protein
MTKANPNFKDILIDYIIEMGAKGVGDYECDIKKLRDSLIKVLNDAYKEYGPFRYSWCINLQIVLLA